MGFMASGSGLHDRSCRALGVWLTYGWTCLPIFLGHGPRFASEDSSLNKNVVMKPNQIDEPRAIDKCQCLHILERLNKQ